jgi:hypothetical protein
MPLTGVLFWAVGADPGSCVATRATEQPVRRIAELASNLHVSSMRSLRSLLE